MLAPANASKVSMKVSLWLAGVLMYMVKILSKRP